ncbi:MAG TPA: threonylcarbamoyl-AMP synthase [Devosia sp.]|nr:threonylcarbamoyl-AMP synthase [Devosia sp.]
MSETTTLLFDFDAALEHLRAENVCGFPTDTVFGLGGRADSSRALNSLFELKKRQKSRAIVALCADLAMAQTLVEFSPTAHELTRFWPGGLTLVLPRKPDAAIAPEAYAGLDSLGVRVPDLQLVVELIRALGVPLATTSANISGTRTLSSAYEIANGFDMPVPVLEHDTAPSGQASTILKVQGEQVVVLRKGSLSTQEIEATLNIQIKNPN